jgi:hypothetical protein
LSVLTKKPTAEQHRLAKLNNERNFADPERVARLLANDSKAYGDFLSNSWAIGCY